MLTTTTANPMTVMMPNGSRTMLIPALSTDAMGSCVELKPVSLEVSVGGWKVLLDVTLSCSVLFSTVLITRGVEVVAGKLGRKLGNGTEAGTEAGLKKSGLMVVKDMALDWINVAFDGGKGFLAVDQSVCWPSLSHPLVMSFVKVEEDVLHEILQKIISLCLWSQTFLLEIYSVSQVKYFHSVIAAFNAKM